MTYLDGVGFFVRSAMLSYIKSELSELPELIEEQNLNVEDVMNKFIKTFFRLCIVLAIGCPSLS